MSTTERETTTEASGCTTIEVRGLRMRYGTSEVLHGLDFTVNHGEVVALLGPNGAGKTTTIEFLEGFRTPTGGEVSVFDFAPLTGGESWRARTGVVLQSWRDHPRWRVRELLVHLGEFYRPFSTPERPRPWDADELLDRILILAGGRIVADSSPDDDQVTRDLIALTNPGETP